MLGAVLTGIIYKAHTLVEWQAIQTWRIEWLLAAAASATDGHLTENKSVSADLPPSFPAVNQKPQSIRRP
jgi:hypothetical protein